MDDGLFLNLSTDAPSNIPRKQKATGGRWKDRQRAKKIEQKKVEKVTGSKVTKPRPHQGPRPVKKRTDPDQKRPQGKPRERKDDKHMIKKIHDADKTKSGQETFVSSIFSSNPDHEEVEVETEKYIPQAASNAPLKDSTEFEGLGVNSKMCELLKDKMGMERPTKIQQAVLPKLIEQEQDLFIQAETGSGKTLAYALPILERLMQVEYLDRNSGLFAIIIAPTRELSTQIYSVLEKLIRCCHWLVPGIVIGGEKKKSEKQRIRKGINVLVGTPGRLADHFDNTESLDVSQVRWVVMDEGDMLMELGFEETINKIMDKLHSRSQIQSSPWKDLPRRRVNVLCSATMKNNVKRLSERSLSNAAKWISADNDSNTDGKNNKKNESIAPAQLEQRCIVVPAKLRLVTLASVLLNMVKANKQGRIMVFFSCSDSVNFHFDTFTRNGVNPNGEEEGDSTVMTAPFLGENVCIYKLYGALNQAMRTATLAAFKKPHDGPSILFSTDLLSRGLDLPLITNVVEYDPPGESEEHLHRVGRTARAGAAGSSHIFLLPGKEEGYLDVLKPLHPNGIQNESYQNLLKLAFGQSSWETEATTWHLNVERWLLQSDEDEDKESPLTKARNAFKSHVKAYATHMSGERHIFDMKALHLGHIAKSFGLRETPGGGGTGSKSSTNGKGVQKAKKEKDPKKLMMQMARKHASGGADEFNIGY